MKFNSEMAFDGTTYGIQVILRLFLKQQSERMKCKYYYWEGFMI
jgi:hypothetical protein